MSKVKLNRDRASRVRSFVKDNPRASFQDVANQFGTTPKRIMKILAPTEPPHPLPKCEALFCTHDGTHGFGAFRDTRGTYFCFEHKDQGHD